MPAFPAIPPKEVDQILQRNLLPPRPIRCPLEKCAGRYLLEPVLTDRPQPPFDRMMMDGFALRSSDGSGPYKIIGIQRAGQPPQPLPPEKGLAWEICTGGVLPPGADVVIPYEHTQRDGDQLMLTEEAQLQPGNFIHPAGSDQPAGEMALPKGSHLGSREIAVAASFGAPELQVQHLPRIAILSTGDELVDPGATPEAHQIRRSNDVSMDTALALNHLHARTRMALPDDPEALLKALTSVTESHDLLICSGGISKGAFDHLPDALEQLGFTALFRRVQQRPGHPMGFWYQENCRVFTLPGNPLSALCGLHRFVLPYLQASLGALNAFTPPESRELQTEPDPTTTTRYVPVELAADGTAIPRPFQNSGDLIRPLASDGFLAISPSSTGTHFPFYPWY